MKIKSIFACGDIDVIAVKFEPGDQLIDPGIFPEIDEEKGEDEFEKALRRWQDTEYLREFFTRYQRDLRAFDPTINPAKAIQLTIQNSRILGTKFTSVSGSAERSHLISMLNPLTSADAQIADDSGQRMKMRGDEWKSWLRLYGLLYKRNFVITGGAIKLRQTMNDRPLLQYELRKLAHVRAYFGNGSGIATYFDIIDDEH